MRLSATCLAISLTFLPFTACQDSKRPTAAQQRSLLEARRFSEEIARASEVPPSWVRIATLTVEGYTAKTIYIESAVLGKPAGGAIACEFVTSHRRIRAGKKWSPLPMAVFTKDDPEENVVPEFESVLDF